MVIRLSAEEMRKITKACGPCVEEMPKREELRFICVKGRNLEGKDMAYAAVGSNGYMFVRVQGQLEVVKIDEGAQDFFTLLIPPFKVARDAVQYTIDDHDRKEDMVEVTVAYKDGKETVFMYPPPPDYYFDWKKVTPEKDKVSLHVRFNPKYLISALTALKDEEFVDCYFGTAVQPVIIDKPFCPISAVVCPVRT